MDEWHLYIVRCVDGTYYTGVAKDVGRRIQEHNGRGTVGARYTRARRPVELVYDEVLPSRSAAARREHEIRRLGRKGKEVLIAQGRPTRRRSAAGARR